MLSQHYRTHSYQTIDLDTSYHRNTFVTQLKPSEVLPISSLSHNSAFLVSHQLRIGDFFPLYHIYRSRLVACLTDYQTSILANTCPVGLYVVHTHTSRRSGLLVGYVGRGMVAEREEKR